MAHFRCFSTIKEIKEKCYYQQELGRATSAPSLGSAAKSRERGTQCLKSSIVIKDTRDKESEPSLQLSRRGNSCLVLTLWLTCGSHVYLWLICPPAAGSPWSAPKHPRCSVDLYCVLLQGDDLIHVCSVSITVSCEQGSCPVFGSTLYPQHIAWSLAHSSLSTNIS